MGAASAVIGGAAGGLLVAPVVGHGGRASPCADLQVWRKERSPTPTGGILALDVDPSGRRIAAATPASAAYVVACQVCTTGTELARLADTHATRELDPEERSRFGSS